MPSICICLANDPILSVFSFKPGERINIHVAFGSEQIPRRYRLQILDHKQNSRLNRYGKGLTDILVNNWPIPTSIRDDHLGIWQVRVDSIKSIREVRSLPDEVENTLSFSQIFFVEKTPRAEFPLLGGDIIYQLSETLPFLEEALVSNSGSIEHISPITGKLEGISKSVTEIKTEIPVTEVRGIGQTYADRLTQINVLKVSDLWYYEDRIALAEVMRISDHRLEKMLQDAELLLSEKAEEISRIDIAANEEFIPDDLRRVKGITSNHIKQLSKLGMRSKTDLLDFQDIPLLKKSLRVSTVELSEMLASIGRIIEPESVRKPESLEPVDQPVIVLKGIGKVTAEKLKSIGILTVENLLKSSFEELSGITTKKTYQKWLLHASQHADKPLTDNSEYETMIEPSSELLKLPGIGPKTLEKLHSHKIFTSQDLVNFKEPDLLRKVLRMSKPRFTAFIEKILSDVQLKE